jgi:thymidylate kinase
VETGKDRGSMILVEGLDLAGKSTLTKALTAELTKRGLFFSCSKNSLIPSNPIALKADAFRKEDDAGLFETGALFLAAHLYDAHVFSYPAPHVIHIQDSSWLRTLAYHTMHQTRWIPEFVQICSSFQPKFDVVIYLTASSEVRKLRVLKREKETQENDKDDYLSWFHPERAAQHDRLLMEKTLEHFPHAFVIDTTYLSAEEVFQKAWIYIEDVLSDTSNCSKCLKLQ